MFNYLGKPSFLSVAPNPHDGRSSIPHDENRQSQQSGLNTGSILYSHAVHLDQRERSDFLVYIIETYLEIRNHKRRDIGNHIQCAAWVTAVSKRSHASIVSDQGHSTDCFGRISVRKTCNRLTFSVREMSSRAFLIKIN